MKKLLALVLAVVTAFSLVGVPAVAEGEEQPLIVVDGIKDQAYDDFRSVDHSYWDFFVNNTDTTEVVDPDRVRNHVWFTWDDDYIYLYFQAVNKYEELYQPYEGEERPAGGTYFYEVVNLYLDTYPSAGYASLCSQGATNSDGTPAICDHFCCSSKNSEQENYRLMARYVPGWDEWYNYYESNEGMFMTFEEFSDLRGEDYEDLEMMYDKTNGDCQAVGFIDYENKTYGFEVKYPRVEGEDYFQFNISNDINEYVYEEEGPELPYKLSFCPAWWLNSEGLLEIWFADYPNGGEIPAEVNAILRMRGELPEKVEELTLENKEAVLKLNEEFSQLIPEHKERALSELPDLEEYLQASVDRVNTLDYLANLGDVNKDENINANDALIALRAAVGKTQLDDASVIRADVNGDAAVNAKDALEMLQFAVQKRTQFSAAELYEL